MAQISVFDSDAGDTLFLIRRSNERLARSVKYTPGADGGQYAVYHVKRIETAYFSEHRQKDEGNMTAKTKDSPASKAKNTHVPIGAQSHDHSARLAGIPFKQFFTDAPTFARVQVLVSEYYGVDSVINFWDVYNVEAEALGQIVEYNPEGIPDADRTRPLIASPSDLDRIHPPDPRKSGRMPWVAEINRLFLDLTGTLERIYFTAPFSLAVNIRGYENIVDDMFERPAFVHRLFKFLCDDVLSPYLEAMRNDLGIPDLLMDGRDAWASPPLISLDMMDEFVVTYTARLRKNLGDRLVTRGNWGDARSLDPERFFSQKLQCSPGVLSVLDPDLFEVGPQKVKKFADKHKVLIAAGVDASLLQAGPAEAIANRIKFYIDTMARNGDCMIHLNQIPAQTPPEHIHAAVAACHTYGRYPIAENLDGVTFDLPKKVSFSEFIKNRGN
jgi:uroporphyrinogen-III decarboxylase